MCIVKGIIHDYAIKNCYSYVSANFFEYGYGGMVLVGEGGFLLHRGREFGVSVIAFVTRLVARKNYFVTLFHLKSLNAYLQIFTYKNVCTFIIYFCNEKN